MKKCISFLLILSIFLMPCLTFAEDNLQIFGEGAILMDADSSQVLFEKNGNKKLYPASTTKIMTGILAIELGNLNDIVTVDSEVVKLTDGSHIALEPGEELSLDQLLHALLIGSANDSALAIAKHISGSIDVFVNLMNEKARELGAMDTNFVNPNGLHDDNHVTTAHDLALIAQYAMKNDTFKNLVKNYIYTIPPTNKKTEPRFLKSANRLIYSTRKINVDGNIVNTKYDGANGVKTGFTKKAQNCLVSSVNKDNQNLIAVVLNSNIDNVFVDTHKLFNYGFNNFTSVKLANENQFIKNFKIKDATIPIIAGITANDLSVNIPKTDSVNVDNKLIELDNLRAPIKKGQVLGKIEYYLDGSSIGSVNILSTEDIPKDPNSSIYKKLLNKWYLFVFLVYFLLRLHNYLRIKKLRKFRKSRREY